MRTKIMLAVAAMTVGLSVPAAAQPPPEGAPQAERGAKAQARKQRRVKKMRHRVLRRQLGLTDARIEKVEKILARFEPKRRKVKQGIGGSRRELRQLFRADSSDQKAYGKALTGLRRGHKAMQQLRDQEFAALQAELTPKEQAMMLRALQQIQRRMQRLRAERRGEGGDRRGGPPGPGRRPR